MAYQQRSQPVDVVIDIETLVLPPTAEEIEAFASNWKPPANIKDPERIEARRQEAFANIPKAIEDEKRFTLGGKRMICCALGTISRTGSGVTAIESYSGDDLGKITKGIVDYLDRFDSYRLIGWNHRSFDLPEICKAFRQTGVRPRSRPGKWDLVDLMQFPFERKGLKATAQAFGLEVMDVNGSDVQSLYDAGQWDKIREYNEHDVRITGEIYLAATALFTF